MKQTYLRQMLSRDKHYRRAFVLAVAVPIFCAAAAALVLWAQKKYGISFLPCSIKHLTGFNCVSCGATRATFALLRGDLLTAIWYNPLYIAFLICLSYLYVRLVISLLARPYRRFVIHLDWKRAVIISAIVVVFTVIRNMPFYQAVFF